jgi:hypothetical protein
VEHSKVGRQFNSGIDYRFEVCQGLAAIGADFVFDGNEIRRLEQNPETKSVGRKWLGVAKTWCSSWARMIRLDKWRHGAKGYTPSKDMCKSFRIHDRQEPVFHSHGWAEGPSETRKTFKIGKEAAQKV